MASVGIDYSKPFDATKLKFTSCKALDMGGSVMNFKYDSQEIKLKLPFMTAVYGISKPFSMRTKKDGSAADEAPAAAGDGKKTESNKCSIDLTIDDTDPRALDAEKWMTALDEAVYAHVTHDDNFDDIYKNALKLNKDKLKDKKKEIKADTVKRYRLIKGDDFGNRRLCIKFPSRIDSVEMRNTKGRLLSFEDVTRDSQVRNCVACLFFFFGSALLIGPPEQVQTYFKVTGVFISDTMVTLQSQVLNLLAKPGGAQSAVDVFAGDFDDDAVFDDEDEPKAKKAKSEPAEAPAAKSEPAAEHVKKIKPEPAAEPAKKTSAEAAAEPAEEDDEEEEDEDA